MTITQAPTEIGEKFGKMPGDSKPLKNPLRLGLVCNSLLQPLWLRQVLSDLLSAKIIEIPLIVVHDVSRNSLLGQARLMLRDVSKSKSFWLYLVYRALDRMVCRIKPDAQILGPIDDITPISSKIVINVDKTPLGSLLGTKDGQSIASYDLDVVFCSGLVVEDVGEFHLARHGVWTIEQAAGFDGSTPVAAFWEVMERAPVLQVALSRRDPPHAQGQVLGQSFLPTHLPEDLRSVHGAYNRTLWIAAGWLGRKLNDLYLKGAPALEELKEGGSREPLLFVPQPPPSNKKMLKLAAKRTVQRVRDWARNLTEFDQWGLGYKFHESAKDAFGIHGLTTMLPPKDRFWADPFPVKHGKQFFIFFEEFLYSTTKGHISVIQMDANGRWEKPEKILERNYHLSYPSIFQWDGNYYMVPESASNRTIELYKCDCFPFQWEVDRILMEDTDVADPTLAEIDGMWWLFVGTKPYKVIKDDNYMDLSLFWAETPLGPWKPHQNNPVKSDARSSRPAGRLFWWNGDLYRPAQDCSRDYGYAVSINRITKLSQEEFEEEEVAKICPEWVTGAKCVHTLNGCDGLTIVDLMRTVFKV